MTTFVDANVPIYLVGAGHPNKQRAIAAHRLLERAAGLSARDAIHVATMRRRGVDDILTFDSGFDRIGGIRRLPDA